MKVINKKFFVAEDGVEFTDEKEALEYNETLYFKNPIHLTNEQIIDLLKIIYSHWLDNPSHVEYVTISIAKENRNGTGFAYILTVKTFDDKSTSDYSGIITGYNDFKIFGDSDDLRHSGFSVKRVYRYLESINFFKRCDSIPTPNKNIQDEYFMIFDNTIQLEVVPQAD